MNKNESIEELYNKIKSCFKFRYVKTDLNNIWDKEEDYIIIELYTNYIYGNEITDLNEIVNQFWTELKIKEWSLDNKNNNMQINIIIEN